MLGAAMFLALFRVSMVIFSLPDLFCYIEKPIKRILIGKFPTDDRKETEEKIEDTEEDECDNEDDYDKNRKKMQ
jgi:hypothetical protein